MKSIVAAFLIAPAALAAQTPAELAPRGNRGIQAGITGFSGGDWQPSGLDVGLSWALGSAAGRAVSASVRIGTFVQDQAVIYGRTTGFFGALLAGARTPLATLAEVGTEQRPSLVRFVGSVELGVQLGANSPLPQGSTMGIASAMVGLAFASGPERVDQSFALLIGPAWFFGKATTTHAQLSLRYFAPLH